MSEEINRILQLSGVKAKVKTYQVLTERNTVNELDTWTEKLPDGTLRTHTHDYKDEKPNDWGPVGTGSTRDKTRGDSLGEPGAGWGTGTYGTGPGSGTSGQGRGNGSQGSGTGQGTTGSGTQSQGTGQGYGQSTGVPGLGSGQFPTPGGGSGTTIQRITPTDGDTGFSSGRSNAQPTMTYPVDTDDDDEDDDDNTPFEPRQSTQTVINPPNTGYVNPAWEKEQERLKKEKEQQQQTPAKPEPKTPPGPSYTTVTPAPLPKTEPKPEPKKPPGPSYTMVTPEPLPKTEPKPEPKTPPGPSYTMVTPEPLPKTEPKAEPLPAPGPSYTMITPEPLPKTEPTDKVITPHPTPEKTVNVPTDTKPVDTGDKTGKGSTDVTPDTSVDLPKVPFDPKKQLWTRQTKNGVEQNWDPKDQTTPAFVVDITDDPKYSDPSSPDYIPPTKTTSPQTPKNPAASFQSPAANILLPQMDLSEPVISKTKKTEPPKSSSGSPSAGAGSSAQGTTGTSGTSGEKGGASAIPMPRPLIQKPWEPPRGKFQDPGMIGSPDIKGTVLNPGTDGPNPLLGVPELGSTGKDPSAISGQGGTSVYSADTPGERVLDIFGRKKADKTEDIDRIRALAGLK